MVEVVVRPVVIEDAVRQELRPGRAGKRRENRYLGFIRLKNAPGFARRILESDEPEKTWSLILLRTIHHGDTENTENKAKLGTMAYDNSLVSSSVISVPPW